jgi:RNA polymerase sigma-70 factor (ECF subfamily)
MEAHLRAVPAPNVEEADLGAYRDFEEFYAANRTRLYTALCLVTGNRQEAEEITQDAFLRVFERWDRVATMDDADGYLFRVGMNQFRNRYQRARLALRRTFLPVRTVDELAEVETRDEVVRLLQRLTPRERAAVVLTAIVDLSAEEAGRLLGIEASTVRALATRARAHMRHEVVDRR